MNQDPSRRESVPPIIPDHTPLERIGTGAYGEVWLARCALGTLRAVKVVYRNRFEDERPYDREFNGILRYEPISRTHPNLVTVWHAGRNDAAGFFYYVMELADNAFAPSVPPSKALLPGSYKPKTLRAVLDQTKGMAPVEAAQIGVQLAGALACLHQQGLVHRDIKPSNVIFVDGRPKLADIGLIAGSGDSRSFVGTEGFIPPEGPGTPRADVFSLGKLLYELSTGRDRLDFPQLPSRLLDLPEREALLELNEVFTKACAPDPNRRYPTATELVAELNLYLSGRSLRETHSLSRRLNWLKRSAAAGIVLLLLAFLALWWARNTTLRARQGEQESAARARSEAALRQRAQSAERDARSQLYAALLEQARATVRGRELGQRVQALDALRRAAVISNSVELRAQAFAALALPDLRPVRDLPLDPGLTLVQMDPGLERYAACRGTGPVEIRSSADQRLLASLPASTNLPAHLAVWSPDARFLAVERGRTTAKSAYLEVWDTSNSQRVLLATGVSFGTAIFHPHLPQFMAGVDGSSIGIWSLLSRETAGRLELGRPIELLAISPDGQHLAVSHPDDGEWMVAVYRLSDAARLVSHRLPRQLSSLAWDPRGCWIALTDHGSAVSLLDTTSGELRPLGRHKQQAVLASFAPDGRYLFSAGWEREIICWDLWTSERALTISLDSFMFQLGPEGRSCAIIAPDRIQLLQFERPVCGREFAEDLGGRLYRAVFSPDGKWLAASGQQRLGLWNLGDTGPGRLLPEGSDSRPFFSADSRYLVASRDDGCLVWELSPASGSSATSWPKPLPAPRPQGFTSSCVASNQVVITCSSGSALLKLDTLAANVGRWSPTINGVSTASPDGRLLAIFKPYTAALHLYSLPGFEAVSVLTNQANIREVEFSPDGRQVFISSNSGIVSWNTADWQPMSQITNFVKVMFGAQDTTAWLSRDVRTAGLYDYPTLQPVLPLPAGVLPLALSPDGQYLAVSLHAQRLQLWDLAQLNRTLSELGLNLSR